MLANTEVQVSTTILPGQKITGPLELQIRLITRRQVSRPADHEWHVLGNRIQDFATAVTCRITLLAGIKDRNIAIPTVGQAPGKQGRQFRSFVRILALAPVVIALGAPLGIE